MRVGNEDINIRFMMSEERMNMRLVDDTGTLALREDKVGKADKAKVGIERKPVIRVRLLR